MSDREKNMRNTDNEKTMFIPGSKTQRQQRYTAPQKNHPYSSRQSAYQESDMQNRGNQQGQQYNSRQNYQQGNQQYSSQQNYSQGNQQYGSRQNYPQNNRQYQGQRYGQQTNAPNGYPAQNQQGRGSQPPQRKRSSGNQSPQRRQKRQPPKKQHKSIAGKIILRVIFIFLAVFLLIFGIYSCTALAIIGKIDKTETGARERTNGAMSAKYVTSVLIIGSDGRTDDERGRSDSMILLSMNTKTNEITMTSFMRDSYVYIEGYGNNKLNAAYSFGGPELLMDTIESNFNVKIDNYISVDFKAFASVIDSAGGLDIEVTDDEAQEINTILMAEVNELMGDEVTDDLLSGGGKLHLNGKQALSYARIRYIGNADFERTERQREVLELLMKKVRGSAVSFLKNAVSSALPDLTTNMTTWEMYKLSLKMPFALIRKYDFKQIRIPAENTYSEYYDDNVGSALYIDDMQTNERLLMEIFDD